MNGRKINFFSHIIPPGYKEALIEAAPPHMDIIANISSTPTVFDLDQRFRILDRYENLQEVLSIASPGVGEVAGPAKSAELSKRANDAIAELLARYPDRFIGGIACLPLNNIEAAIKEIDRSLTELKLNGIEIHTPVADRPIDSPEFLPLYEKMSEYDKPIWLHPRRASTYPDYRTEDVSKYRVFSVFGWPYETTVAMARLVFSGILEKYHNLKIITHHCGGMVPFFSERVKGSYDRVFQDLGDNFKNDLTHHHIHYFKKFYCDTAINGNTSALMCAYDFFGAEHMLFGTDMPFDTENGARNLRQIINAIEQMSISETEKQMIFEYNARKLLDL